MKTTFLDSCCKLKYLSLSAARGRRRGEMESRRETVETQRRRGGAMVGRGGQSKVMMRRWWWWKDIKRWKDGSGGALHNRLNCTIPAVIHQLPQSICPENLLRARGDQEEWVSQTFVHVFEGIFLVFHLLSSFQHLMFCCTRLFPQQPSVI